MSEQEIRQGDFSRGSVPRIIWRLGLPVLLAELVHVLYNIVDRTFIGYMGEGGTLALTGLGICFPLITFIGAFAQLFSTGGATLATIARGRGDDARAERIAGESHYPLKKMLALAIDGITSLSVKPLRLITGFGLLVAAISFIGVLWALISAIIGKTVAGWASMTCIVCFVSGVQLLSLGIIGEYIGNIVLTLNSTPQYIIREKVNL